MSGFSPAQRAIYDEVRTAVGLDRQLMALADVAAREGTDPQDVAAVRQWLSDQDLRMGAR